MMVDEGRGAPQAPDHYYWVYIPDLGGHSWFRENEMTLVEGRTP